MHEAPPGDKTMNGHINIDSCVQTAGRLCQVSKHTRLGGVRKRLMDRHLLPLTSCHWGVREPRHMIIEWLSKRHDTGAR